MVALHCGQRIHSPSGTPRFGLPTVAMASRFSVGVVLSGNWFLSQPSRRRPSRGIALVGQASSLSSSSLTGWKPVVFIIDRLEACPTSFVIDLAERRERRALDVLQE